jgi:hypothetical protein
MKSFSRLLPPALLLAAFTLRAAPLAGTTAVQTQPDPSAPAITFLGAGTEPVPAAADVAAPPAGWVAVSVPGPFEAYVENKNLNKALDVIPGSPLHLAPKEDSGVLAIAQKGDRIIITGLRGKWTQIRLEKSLVGYIHPGPLPAAVPAQPPGQPGTEAAGALTEAPALPAAPAPVSGPPTTAAGKPADEGALAQGSGVVTRTFEGHFVSSKSFFAPQRPYDWQLNDSAGARIAYLDVGRLLLTEQLDKYIDHDVSVYGAVRPVPDTKDIVVVVESLQLK